MGWIPEPGSGGVTDHGNLSGLGDDDHPQYLTEAEHDAHDHSGVPGVGTSGGGCSEILMQDGTSDPPVPLENEAQDDWLYEECGGVTESSSDPDEDEYWARKAALLDPAAFTFEIGTSWTVTVPNDGVYYLYGAWNIEPTRRFHRRPLPMVLSEGTTIEANGTTNAYAYYADPSAVSASRAKYFERVQRLEMLTQHTLVLSISSGTSQATAFPADFDEGLILAQSVQDLAWLGLTDNGEAFALNIWDEVSDTHGIRMAGPIYLPFSRSEFPKIRARRATDHSLSSGVAVVTYVKLPADW